MSQSSIVIRGAREHNLKDVSLEIPRDKLVVITGLSGSGKSSLAFDTIYAEGQRRYVESLSSYARMFLGQMDKPDVDSIDGLSPAVSIDQKTTSKNPRSTVGTVTEIYDYLRLLFARIGIPHCPECGRVIEKQTTDQVADKIMAAAAGRRALVLAPVVRGRKGEFTKLFEDLRREGFSRVRVDGEVRRLDDEAIELDKKFKHTIEVVVDRVAVREDSLGRIAEAVESATKLADGNVQVWVMEEGERPGELLEYSLALSCPVHGHSIDELQPRDFSFNAPYGACPECDGLGVHKVVDVEALIVDPSKPVGDGALGGIFGMSNYYPQIFDAVARHLGYDPATPWQDLVPQSAEDVHRRPREQEGQGRLPHPGRARHQLDDHLLGTLEHHIQPLQRDDQRQREGPSRAVYPRRALYRLPRRPPQARNLGRDRGGQVHLRGLLHEHGRGTCVLPLPGPRRARAFHRRAHREGDRGTAPVPCRRGPGLPDP